MINGDYINSLIENIPLGIAISDGDGLIKDVNLKFMEMFGYKAEELLGKHISDLFDGFKLVKKASLDNINIVREEVFIYGRKNKLRYSLSAFPLPAANEASMDILFIFEDIKKERKLANDILHNRAIYTFDKIISKNQEFLRLIDFAKKVADSKSTILIMGESGTGKEVFAQSIHNYSNRKDNPFIAINSAAIPKTLIESELFGYEEGAFTGAKKTGQIGKFELAHGGTIFLDEIGEMPLDLQTRLLRVLEEGIVSRIGGTERIIVDVRIIAASNKNLREEVAKGRFREDLFYRLNVLPMTIMPLRERPEDIPLLVDYFIKKISRRLNKREIKVSKEEMDILMAYSWPGNVRELENFIELAINLEYVPLNFFNHEINEKAPIHYSVNKDLSMDAMEKNHIINVLKIYDGNITKTAAALGIGRNTLYRKIQKYKINSTNIEQSSIIEQ
ncbi:MAG: sigma 54-interacting transcriptional regulator [Tissierellia bacterium]|nr:sigma 54-interacting transcriptional regulator [Tissierellia bacterium]